MGDKRRPSRWPVVLLAAALCGQAAVARATTVTIFAAASLAEAFGAVARALEAQHAGWQVRTYFAGTQQLAMQIEQGARADLLAAADRHWIDYLAQRGLVAGAPREFARNRLAIILPRANPAAIARIADLARPGVKLALASAAVPIGAYSRELLRHLAAQPGMGEDFADRVLRNVVSEEDNVRGVITKVQLGEVDGGIVYRSDVTSGVRDAVSLLDIPAVAQVTATYPIAVLAGSVEPSTAQAIVEWLMSAAGQRLLADHGLEPVVGE